MSRTKAIFNLKMAFVLSFDTFLCGEVLMFSFTDFFFIYRLRHFHIVACTIVGSFLRVFFTSVGATAFHFPTTGIALCEVLITYCAGTVYHLGRCCAAVLAGGDHHRVYLIDIHRNAVVKDIAFTFEIFTTYFFTIFNDATV